MQDLLTFNKYVIYFSQGLSSLNMSAVVLAVILHNSRVTIERSVEGQSQKVTKHDFGHFSSLEQHSIATG